MTRHIVTPWSFRDGREYVVSVSVGETPKSLCIVVSDKITAEEWSCNYDLKYIENLTHRTGSYKPFDIFISMIKSAILKKSDAVKLELMSYEDLESLRNKKRQSEVVVTAEVGSPIQNNNLFSNNVDLGRHLRSHGSGSHTNNNDGSNKKKYLIVTYVAEFDKVHYPIPMTYSGHPDPIVMQNNILKLKSEVSHLRGINSDLMEELKLLKAEKSENKHNIVSSPDASSKYSINEYAYPNAEVDFNNNYINSQHHQKRTESEYISTNLNSNSFNKCNEQDRITMQKVISTVHKLEEQIQTERVGHLDQIAKLQAQNAMLRHKLEGLESSEVQLREEIQRLERYEAQKTYQSIKYGQNNNNKKKNVNNNDTRVAHRDSRYQMKIENALGVSSTLQQRQRQNSLNRAEGRNYSRRTSTESKNSDGTSRYKPPVGNRSRTRSSSPASRIFDPTAYVKNKKRKEAEISQLRLSRIQSRMRSRSCSTERSNSQTRNNSRDSVTSDKYSVCSVCSSKKGICGHGNENETQGQFPVQRNEQNSRIASYSPSFFVPLKLNCDVLKSEDKRSSSPSRKSTQIPTVDLQSRGRKGVDDKLKSNFPFTNATTTTSSKVTRTRRAAKSGLPVPPIPTVSAVHRKSTTTNNRIPLRKTNIIRGSPKKSTADIINMERAIAALHKLMDHSVE